MNDILFVCVSHLTLFVFYLVQIKKLPFVHECSTTKLLDGKMSTQGWVADRLGDRLKDERPCGGVPMFVMSN